MKHWIDVVDGMVVWLKHGVVSANDAIVAIGDVAAMRGSRPISIAYK
jgi:hypothetical protein